MIDEQKQKEFNFRPAYKCCMNCRFSTINSSINLSQCTNGVFDECSIREALLNVCDGWE